MDAPKGRGICGGSYNKLLDLYHSLDLDFKNYIDERMEDPHCGYYSLLRIWKVVSGNLPFLPAIKKIIERFDPENLGFSFTDFHLHITLEDILFLTGLPIEGKPVLCRGNHDTTKFSTLFEIPDTTTKLKVTELSRIVKDSSKSTIVRMKAFLICIICSVIDPDSDGGPVCSTYLEFVDELELVDSYAWGSAMLCSLYYGFKKNDTSKGRPVPGRVGNNWITLAFFFTRILKLRMTLMSCNEDDQIAQYMLGDVPMIIKFINEYGRYGFDHKMAHEKLASVVTVLDALQECDVEMRPYRDARLPPHLQNQVSFARYIGPIFCGYKQCYHKPHLFPRQFEEEFTEIPDLEPLEKVVPKRNKGGGNQRLHVHFKDHLVVWNVARQSLGQSGNSSRHTNDQSSNSFRHTDSYEPYATPSHQQHHYYAILNALPAPSSEQSFAPSDWYIDSGATNHMSPSTVNLSSITPYNVTHESSQSERYRHLPYMHLEPRLEEETMVNRAKCCDICGDSGTCEALVTCSRCKDSHQHLYCMHTDTVQLEPSETWLCEDCDPRKYKSLKKPIWNKTEKPQYEILRRQNYVNSLKSANSARIKLLSQEEAIDLGEGASNTRVVVKRSVSHSVALKNNAAAPAKSRGMDSEPSLQLRHESRGSAVSHDIVLQRARARVERIPSAVASWSGSCRVYGASQQLEAIHKLQAYPPSRVLKKVYEFSKSMSHHLQFELTPHNDIWVDIDQYLCRDKRDIALYFFPVNKERQNSYDELLELMGAKGYVMRTRIDSMELLICTSRVLSSNCQEWRGRHFLWGLFRKVGKAPQEEVDMSEDMDIDMVAREDIPGKQDHVLPSAQPLHVPPAPPLRRVKTEVQELPPPPSMLQRVKQETL